MNWERLATIRQRIIERQDRRLTERDQTIVELTASVVQLEDDYDAIEAELNALTIMRTPPRVVTVELPTSDIW
ncbi:putative coiled-coil protein SlyX [Arthrobacter sp. CAN_A2]|uniref:hypothetical protein n=1 Tax=Arthrobacter sp. CAN_A2 TaxID=2787718 RepID=UPI0018EFA5A9